MNNMRRAALALLPVLAAWPALGADNAVIVTPGTGVTLRSKDIGGGVQSMIQILGDTSGNAIYGVAGTANANVITIQGIVSGTVVPVADAALLAAVEAQSVFTPGTPGTPNTSTVMSVQGVSGMWPLSADLYDAASRPLGSQVIQGVYSPPLYTQNPTTLAQAAALGTIFGQGVTQGGDDPRDALGQPRRSEMITDGVRYAAIMPPNVSPTPAQTPIVVTPSPIPSLQCPFVAPINQSATTQIVTNPGGKALHICSLFVLSAAGQSISLSEGTGSVCGTAATFLFGGSGGSAAVPANGGVFGLSSTITIPMQKAGDNLCLIQNSSGNVSGFVSYGIY